MSAEALARRLARTDDEVEPLARALEAALGSTLTGREALFAPFVSHLAALAPQLDAEAPADRILHLPWSGARLADLWLAFRATSGETEALRTLEDTMLSPLVHRLGREVEDARDALQSLRTALLVGDGASGPRLLGYTGRGDLARFVKVAATRTWLNAKRGVRREVQDEDRLLEEQAPVDGELHGMKEAYSAAFRVAFKAALATLEPSERNLLRQHYLDGLTMEHIGTLHGVHRVTVHRWIDRARATLAEQTRARMAGALGLRDVEVQSVLRLIQSRLDVSLRSQLDWRE
ncbi:MAG: sigma-70 family RNA polymerase sigma factor [Sandaracinus sp.]